MLPDVVRAYGGSDGDATRALFDRLAALGPAGLVAVELFRAQKNSARAKVYRGGGYRGKAYDRKQWALEHLADALLDHGAALGIDWGWGEDPEQPIHKAVLYVDLPTGQVSFHAGERGLGAKYRGQWDGVPGQSADRICRWCARLLAAGEVAAV